MTRIAAIPTSYQGVEYKSKLEAEWARWFDENGVRHTYEAGPPSISPRLETSWGPGGKLLGYRLPSGRGYLPDFWLPACRTFVEGKGDLTDESVGKALEFATCLDEEVTMVLASSPAGHNFSVISRRGTVHPARYCRFARCNGCGGGWFFLSDAVLTCRCCGHYHGQIPDLRPFPTPIMLNGDGTYTARS